MFLGLGPVSLSSLCGRHIHEDDDDVLREWACWRTFWVLQHNNVLNGNSGAVPAGQLTDCNVRE